MRDVAKINEQFRKRGEGFVNARIPYSLPNFSPVIGLIGEAIRAVHDYEFPSDDATDRNQGVVEVSGHVFRWEIGYQDPSDIDNVSLEPISDRRVLSVFVPEK
jgi:hypothetical protein